MVSSTQPSDSQEMCPLGFNAELGDNEEAAALGNRNGLS